MLDDECSYWPSEWIDTVDVESSDWRSGSSHQFNIASHALRVPSLYHVEKLFLLSCFKRWKLSSSFKICVADRSTVVLRELYNQYCSDGTMYFMLSVSPLSTACRNSFSSTVRPCGDAAVLSTFSLSSAAFAAPAADICRDSFSIRYTRSMTSSFFSNLTIFVSLYLNQKVVIR